MHNLLKDYINRPMKEICVKIEQDAAGNVVPVTMEFDHIWVEKKRVYLYNSVVGTFYKTNSDMKKFTNVLEKPRKSVQTEKEWYPIIQLGSKGVTLSRYIFQKYYGVTLDKNKRVLMHDNDSKNIKIENLYSVVQSTQAEIKNLNRANRDARLATSIFIDI